MVARRLLRTPTFALVTVLSVGFGALAFASVLSVVRGVLLEPLPYRDPGRLVWIWRNYTWFHFGRGWLGGPDIARLREHSEVFDGIVAFRSGESNLNDTRGGAPEQISLIMATDNFFSVLGVRPLLGRGFAAGESDTTAAPVVVLSYALWQRRFGGDPGIVGRDVLLSGEPQRVIGVMPRGFRFEMHASQGDPQPADLYATLQTDLATRSPRAGMFAAMARIRPGAEGRVEAVIDAVAQQLDAEFFAHRGLRLWSIQLREDLVHGVRPALGALFGAGLFLLLALAANLATLLVGRAADRARDVAVRGALGAGRFTSVLDLVAEGVIVCGAGSLLGLAASPWAVRSLLALAPTSLPRIEAIDVDGGVIAITLTACLLMGVVAALAPAWRVAGRPVWSVLRETGARTGGTAAAVRTRALLVVVQVALSLVLLVGAALLGRSLVTLLHVDPGFQASGVLTFRVPLEPDHYPDGASAVAFDERLRARLATLPGVQQAGAINALPLASTTNQTAVSFPAAPGNTGDRDADYPLIDYFSVTEDYQKAMGMRLVEGRFIEARDVAGSPPVAVIDETLARRFYPASPAAGQRMVLNRDTLTVVGVVRQARFYNVFADDLGQVYMPLGQQPMPAMTFALRTQGDPRALLADARAALRELDAGIPLADAHPMTDVVRTSLGQHRLSLVLLLGFALGALVLATMGIYGVVANSVLRRTHEFGVRLALGAGRPGILRLVLREGMGVLLLGLAAGLVAALLVSRVLGSLLYGLRPSDSLTFTAVTVVLALVGVTACLVPGWRATRIPPGEALRID